MAHMNAVWGIDVGQCALKALRMQLAADGSIEVTHFDLIEHPKILSQPDADADLLIRNALDKFLSRNDLTNARVTVSVPGQSSFARFIKLPPVEPKRIPEIVRFEAAQQIPFDIEEVEWDYQTFISPASPDVEVGIFAMRKELVLRNLSNFTALNIEPEVVQLAPLSLYNMMVFDQQTVAEGATVLVDVGANSTDLVVSDGERIWMRSIPLGGNTFTESLVKAFKLPFSKAESLKRSAATSKYARQIFVAMRPVFGDLLSEIQRSLGFYTALHRDAQLKRLICLGNAFRLPGLQKYLEQNLQMEVVRLNAFSCLKPSATINAPAFTENVLGFGVAYGLGVQGLEQAPIRANLLPFTIARQRNWRRERPWFAAAAAVMVAGVGLAGGFTYSANKSLNAQQADPAAAYLQAEQVLAKHRKIQTEVREWSKRGDQEKKEIYNITGINAYRDVALQVAYAVHQAVPPWQDEVHQQVARALSDKENRAVSPASLTWERDIFPFLKEHRGEFRILQIEQLSMEYWEGAAPSSGPAGPTASAPPSGGAGKMGGAEPPARPGQRGQPSQRPTAPAPAAAERGFHVTAVGIVNMAMGQVAPYLEREFLPAVARADRTRTPDIRIRLLEGGIRKVEDVVPPDRRGPGGGPMPPAPPLQPGENLSQAVEPLSRDPMGLANEQDVRFTVEFDALIDMPGQPAAEQTSRGSDARQEKWVP